MVCVRVCVGGAGGGAFYNYFSINKSRNKTKIF